MPKIQIPIDHIEKESAKKEKKKNFIIRALLKRHLKEERLQLDPNGWTRALGNITKEISESFKDVITREEVSEVIFEIVDELYEDLKNKLKKQKSTG
jgi:hypothetical protein